MKIYYYVHTGHRIGLDRFRRATTIVRMLKDLDITLLCSDFRIAHEAKHFGVETSVGIDVVRNIPHIAHHGDKIIFDSDEANPIMLEDMKNFFSSFVHIDNNMVVIDDKYFEEEEKTIELSVFFGDDDYGKDFEKNLAFLEKLNPHLLLGFYYFFDYEDSLKEKFSSFHEFEEYDEVIKKSKILITASPQAALENLASGGKPIYIQRKDYSEDFQELFKSLNVPIVKEYDEHHISVILETIRNCNYYKPKQNSNKIAKSLRRNLNL